MAHRKMDNFSKSSRKEKLISEIQKEKERIAPSNELTIEILAERLNEFRRTKLFSDLKIKIQGKEFDVHKMVLMDASPVFEAMISEKYLKENTLELSPEFVDPEIFDELLDFLYAHCFPSCYEIELTLDNVQSIFKAAHYLDISRLISACEDFMVKEIFEENSDEFYEFSQIYNLNKMKTVSLQKTASNYRDSPGNMRLDYDFEEFKIILGVWKSIKDPQLQEKYYHCILAWVKKDEIIRKPFLPNLLELLPNRLTHPIDEIPPLRKLDPNEIIHNKPRRSFKTSRYCDSDEE